MGSKVFWAIVGGFLIGVFARSFLPLGFSYAAFLALAGFAIVFLSLGDRKRLQSAAIICAALCACALGIARMNVATLSGDPALSAQLNKKVVIEGVVSAEPDVRDTDTLLSIDAQQLVGSTTTPIHAGVLAIVPPHTQISYGDRVRASGTLSVPQSFDTGDGRIFDYPDYLAKQGIEYELSPASVEPTGGNLGNPLQSFAISAKQTYLRGTDAVLPEPEAGLAGGITVGDKRSIGPALTADFQKVSLVQIIVLSGYNITVVLNAVARLLMWTPRFVQFGGAGSVVLFFILMSGGAPSASRAGLMALLAVAARMSGRTFLASRALAAASLALVLWNPFTLAFDPGFQLSAVATLGLIVLTPLFADRLHLLPERFGLREIVASSAGAQIAVLPLLLYQSGQLSILALPANILAMAPMPLAMLFSFIAALGGMLFGSLATPLAFPAYVLLAYIIKVGEILSALPFASIQVGAFGPAWLLLAYACIFGAAAWLYKKKERPVQSVRAAHLERGV